MTTALTLSTGLAPFDNVLVTRLPAEALSVLTDDRPAARRHIERAVVVAQGEAAGGSIGGCLPIGRSPGSSSSSRRTSNAVTDSRRRRPREAEPQPLLPGLQG